MTLSVTRIAFRSLRELNTYDFAQPFDESYAEEVIVPGLKALFKNPDRPVKVWFDFDPEVCCVDVHMEMATDDGSVLQPWLLSFCREPPEESNLTRPCLPLENAHAPFLLDGDFHWPCEVLTAETAIDALQAWASHFWPDWKPRFTCEKIPTLQTLFRQAFSDLEEAEFDLYLIRPVDKITPEVLTFMQEEGLLIVMSTEDGLMLQASTLQIQRLHEAHPALESEVIRTSEGP